MATPGKYLETGPPHEARSAGGRAGIEQERDRVKVHGLKHDEGAQTDELAVELLHPSEAAYEVGVEPRRRDEPGPSRGVLAEAASLGLDSAMGKDPFLLAADGGQNTRNLCIDFVVQGRRSGVGGWETRRVGSLWIRQPPPGGSGASRQLEGCWGSERPCP